MGVQQAIKEHLKKLLARTFHVGQHFGLDILPRHFYSEIPVIHRLRKTDHWREPYSLAGVAGADLDEQLEFVRTTVVPAVTERLRQFDVFRQACQSNGAIGYGPIEAQFLYAFVHTHRPRRITQIGCGISTSVCLTAAADAGYQPEITCIEPFPNSFLREAAGSNRIRLISQPVELLSLDFLNELEAGDLFFVDSTHTLGPAGEVTRIVLEMLPRLGDGVYVHFHDIWLPYDFEPAILADRTFFWHETALLMAFLAFNSRFRIRASLSQLHHQRIDQLAEVFANYQPMRFDRGIGTSPGDYPSSIFLEVGSNRSL